MTELNMVFGDQEIEDYIREAFKQNFEILRLETGIALTHEVKQTALNQVLLYWQVLKEIALSVTDTEVRLSLPQQVTPKEREFGIEGVVDIVQDETEVWMYDIKTHDADYVRANLDLYQDQLIIYTHIWERIHQREIDQTAIICTDYPQDVQEALNLNNDKMLARAIERWQPVIEVTPDLSRIEDTIREFGAVVDQILDHAFAAPPIEKLEAPFAAGQNIRFGTRVCRNCDARFSCSSYRKYARHGRGQAERNFQLYYADLEKGEPLEEWRTTNLEEALATRELRADYGNNFEG